MTPQIVWLGTVENLVFSRELATSEWCSRSEFEQSYLQPKLLTNYTSDIQNKNR